MNKHEWEKKRLAWESLKPFYVPRWAWFKARKHNKEKYAAQFPVYKGKKVILT